MKEEEVTLSQFLSPTDPIRDPPREGRSGPGGAPVGC